MVWDLPRSVCVDDVIFFQLTKRSRRTSDGRWRKRTKVAANMVRSFKKEFGITPYAYLIGAKIERARKQLLAGIPPAQVAVDTGFHDQPHLTRHFKRHVPVTPGQYASRFFLKRQPARWRVRPQNHSKTHTGQFGCATDVQQTSLPTRRRLRNPGVVPRLVAVQVRRGCGVANRKGGPVSAKSPSRGCRHRGRGPVFRPSHRIVASEATVGR